MRGLKIGLRESLTMNFGKKRPDAPTSGNRRAAPRDPVGLDGKAMFNDTSKDCSVVDLTRKGARIRLQGFAALPDKFDLHVPEREISVRATVQWRLDNEVGVLFESTRSGPPADFGLLARVEKLEAAVTRLEAMLTNSAAPDAAE
jgi:hypothetical protein